MRTCSSVVVVLIVSVVLAGCGGGGAPASTPTSAPAPTATSAPSVAPTEPPTPAPTAAPTVEPSPTSPRETVAFNWAPGAVPPSDADDVAVIVTELKSHPGILGGTGNEIGINVFYDPTVITIEEIEQILAQIGHPVVRNE